MIQYLQRLKKRKGFTLIELIVVLAIIAVLSALIIPNLVGNRGSITGANSCAEDYYTIMQMLFTKYSKYENHLSRALKAEADAIKAGGVVDDRLVKYDEQNLGNYPVNKYTYIELSIVNNQVVYFHVSDTLEKLLNDTRGATSLTPFEEQLMRDFDATTDGTTDGTYYALIETNKVTRGSTGTDFSITVKVHSAYYTRFRLDAVTGSPANYQGTLLFADDNRLANKEIMGCFTDRKPSGGTGYIGAAGTYFMNVDGSLVPTA